MKGIEDTGTGKLRLERDGHVAVLAICNPPANTWDEESLAALAALMPRLDAERDVFALVVRGEGEKFFSAGADLNQFADGDAARARRVARRFGEAFEALAVWRGVTIAAINGFAMGGGLECALACDVRIAERQARLALPEATVGLLPAGGGTQRLPQLVGEGWAKRLILCGERVSAEQALAIGLVEEVVDAGAAFETAMELARKVGNQSPVAVTACKALIEQARGGVCDGGLSAERERFVDLFDTDDQCEGVNAFLEKRSPQWRNQ